ncbi:MAG: hypothetical protein QN716_09985 [Nitrososphaeraceae archaeon]|nr:hypothetical protein [Nitrososphaeraceae archaeon]
MIISGRLHVKSVSHRRNSAGDNDLPVFQNKIQLVLFREWLPSANYSRDIHEIEILLTTWNIQVAGILSRKILKG